MNRGRDLRKRQKLQPIGRYTSGDLMFTPWFTPH